jgi:hypothetical protein
MKNFKEYLIEKMNETIICENNDQEIRDEGRNIGKNTNGGYKPIYLYKDNVYFFGDSGFVNQGKWESFKERYKKGHYQKFIKVKFS